MGNDERDPGGRVVGEKTMSLLTMLTQRFTMVSSEDDESRIEQAVLFQVIKELSQGHIDVGHLTFIQMLFVLSLERLRRFVGGMRIPTMDPEKPRGSSSFQPFQGALDHSFSTSL
jgi:hypothetical protein